MDIHATAKYVAKEVADINAMPIENNNLSFKFQITGLNHKVV